MSAKSDGHVFWLMRCGETTWARDGRLRGVTDIPLSGSGRSTVNGDAHRLIGRGLTLICHPGDEAAVESAQLVAEQCGAKKRELVALSDPDLGLLEGMTEQAFADRYAKRHKSWKEDPLALTPPEGEELIEARGRVFRAIAKQLRKAKGEVVFILHDVSLGLLRCWLADQPANGFWKMASDRPRVERYALTAEALKQLEATASESLSEA